MVMLMYGVCVVTIVEVGMFLLTGFLKKMKKKFGFRLHVRCGTNGGGGGYVWGVCCSHKGSRCFVNSHCSKLGSLSDVFVTFVSLHNTVVTVHVIVLVFASQLCQNFLGIYNMYSALCAQYPSQVDEHAVLHLNAW